MKNSKVVNVQGSGMFKELYVFEVELENKDIGKIYRKSNDSKLTNGQEISYTINEKGSIKIVTDYQKNNPTQSIPQKSNDVQKLIVKQSSLKAAVDFNSNCTAEEVLHNADKFYNWVMGANNTSDNFDSRLKNKIDEITDPNQYASAFDAKFKGSTPDDLPF
tara:strand:+ start:2334 stop:2819 length:486 start_codon:yes stop_codon:yes gene_type:complete